MCKDCGCEEANKSYFKTLETNGKFHHHGDGHWHSHDDQHTHDHQHTHTHGHGNDHEHHKIINTATPVLAQNDEIAQKNRMWFLQNKILCLNWISSPGTGKTMLLEKTLNMLSKNNKITVLVGDQTTTLDADRLHNKGATVKQINTHSSCHLDAPHIQRELGTTVKPDTDILIIENVGNLVCPSAFDLGEAAKIALLSCTEGEDKPVKYPVLFSQAQAIVLTKMDLVPHLDWSLEKAQTNIRKLNSWAPIFKTSSRTEEGLTQWVQWIEDRHVQIQTMQ